MIPGPLLLLARAAAAGRPVRVTCREAGDLILRREVDVLSLGWRFGGWVALARDREHGGLRVLPIGCVASVRPVERRRRPRGPGQPARPRRSAGGPSDVDAVEFALADLQAPEAGPARRCAVRLPRPLAPLGAVLFAGAEVVVDGDGAEIRLRVTDPAALAQMAASLGAAVG